MHAAGSTAESAAGGDRGSRAAATSQHKREAGAMRSPGAPLSFPRRTLLRDGSLFSNLPVLWLVCGRLVTARQRRA